MKKNIVAVLFLFRVVSLSASEKSFSHVVKKLLHKISNLTLNPATKFDVHKEEQDFFDVDKEVQDVMANANLRSALLNEKTKDGYLMILDLLKTNPRLYYSQKFKTTLYETIEAYPTFDFIDQIIDLSGRIARMRKIGLEAEYLNIFSTQDENFQQRMDHFMNKKYIPKTNKLTDEEFFDISAQGVKEAAEKFVTAINEISQNINVN